MGPGCMADREAQSERRRVERRCGAPAGGYHPPRRHRVDWTATVRTAPRGPTAAPMITPSRTSACAVLGQLALALCLAVTSWGRPQASAADTATGESVVAGPKAYDAFHPDRGTPATPLYGGRLIVHAPAQPKHINYVTENSGETRRMIYVVHDNLLEQDWEYHDFRPKAAESIVVEDLVVLTEEAGARIPGAIDARVVRRDGKPGLRAVKAVYGEVAPAADGEGEGGFVVTPRSPLSDVAEPLTLAAADVDVIERGTVFTFTLREGVRWHPSQVYAGDAAALARIGTQTLDTRDVHFSWALYQNPAVDCGERRFMFEKMTDCRVLDERRVRFIYQEQYAFALGQVGVSLLILPSHLYDLSDEDNPAYDPQASQLKQAEHINQNPHNQLWVGIGPYRITEWNSQYIEAQRFTDEQGAPLYYNHADAGYADVIRWRHIADDEVAMTALENGEVDFFDRVKTSDYFGERTARDSFTRRFYKGYRYLGIYGYVGWNSYRPQLAERDVRIALAHAFDHEAYRMSNYMGLARQTTGPVPYGTDGYPMDLKPFPYNPARAVELLEEAGWYDRDGDDIVDKDGVKLSIEVLYPAGNQASALYCTKLQEALRAIGVELRIAQLEWATLRERVLSRDFDACSLAWIPPLEPDPEQLWHSRHGARDARSSNNAGVCDDKVDGYVVRIQRELDVDARMALWREFQRYLYLEIQPYLFSYNVPNKYAISRRIRGFQHFAIDPGYALRRWYFSDPSDPALRKTLAP